jgi:hypothetical protein
MVCKATIDVIKLEKGMANQSNDKHILCKALWYVLEKRTGLVNWDQKKPKFNNQFKNTIHFDIL